MAGDKMREDQLQAVWFAAGTAAFIACIERAVVVSLFAHWRVWAFLALNLLLLAILFTSKSREQSVALTQGERVSGGVRHEGGCCCCFATFSPCHPCCKYLHTLELINLT